MSSLATLLKSMSPEAKQALLQEAQENFAQAEAAVAHYTNLRNMFSGYKAVLEGAMSADVSAMPDEEVVRASENVKAMLDEEGNGTLSEMSDEEVREEILKPKVDASKEGDK